MSARLSPEALVRIEDAWSKICGPCDGGLPMGCSCPSDDPRTIIGWLIGHIKVLTDQDALRRDVLNQQRALTDEMTTLGRGFRIRAEIAETAADAAVEARWFTGTQKDADDALLNYETHHGRTVPGMPGRDGWDG